MTKEILMKKFAKIPLINIAIKLEDNVLCPGARLLPGYQCRRADEEAVRAWLAGIDLL